PPLQPAAPTTSSLTAVDDRAQMQVSWVAPNDNGDAIDGYQLQVINGSSVVQTIDVAAGKTSQAVVVDTSTTAYTYKVRAENKAGWGDYSPASAPRRAAIKPDAPSRPTISDYGDRHLIVNKNSYTLTAAELNGASASETVYQYSLNGAGWQSSTSWDGSRINGLNNGTSYTVRIRAVTTVDGVQYTSDPSPASAAVTPYGLPPKPNVTARNNGTTVTFSWSPNGDNGASIDGARISVNGGGWQSVSANGSTTTGSAYSKTHSIAVQVHNKAGWSASGTDSARTNDPPPPPDPPNAWVTNGAYVGSSDCADGCHKFHLNTNSTFPGGSHTVRCYSSAFPNGWSTNTYNFGANASFDLYCHHGDMLRNPPHQVWVVIDGKAYERRDW
ncbi:fibronectin type III domain-containing protein, partial [Microbacterium sp. CIAB417]|uniref:fibronectin type III domain-containing protein n=1 Tax=Microbacterium sp. CIAB417 TaxID=2860287 RepID=UPI001FADA118